MCSIHPSLAPIHTYLYKYIYNCITYHIYVVYDIPSYLFSYLPLLPIDSSHLGRPTMEGKTVRGASSPAKPALHMPLPLSTTSALAICIAVRIYIYIYDHCVCKNIYNTRCTYRDRHVSDTIKEILDSR